MIIKRSKLFEFSSEHTPSKSIFRTAKARGVRRRSRRARIPRAGVPGGDVLEELPLVFFHTRKTHTACAHRVCANLHARLSSPGYLSASSAAPSADARFMPGNVAFNMEIPPPSTMASTSYYFITAIREIGSSPACLLRKALALHHRSLLSPRASSSSTSSLASPHFCLSFLFRNATETIPKRRRATPLERRSSMAVSPRENRALDGAY